MSTFSKYLILLSFIPMICTARNFESNTRGNSLNGQVSTEEIYQDLKIHRQKINDLSENLKAFRKKFRSFDSDSIQTVEEPKKQFYYPPTTEALNGIPFVDLSPKPKKKTVETLSTTDTQKEKIHDKEIKKKEIGFYFLPFIGLQSSGNYIYEPANMLIEQETGLATGGKLGFEGKYFFLESEYCYSRNDLKRAQYVPSYSFVLGEGKTENFGFLLNLGGKIPLSSKINLAIGAGGGIFSQKIAFALAGASISEKKNNLFSYQFFTGLNYQINKYLKMGLDYRWRKLMEMTNYSSRELHLIALSLGYSF